MFRLISTQQVQDETGAVVRIVDRQHVEWRNDTMSAIVEVDFGRGVGVFCDTINGWHEQDKSKHLSASEMAFALDQIVDGLRAMNLDVERCE